MDNKSKTLEKINRTSEFENESRRASMYANKGDYSEAISILESLLKEDLSADVRQSIMAMLEQCKAKKMEITNKINSAKNYMRAGNYSAADSILRSLDSPDYDDDEIRSQVLPLRVECMRHMK